MRIATPWPPPSRRKMSPTLPDSSAGGDALPSFLDAGHSGDFLRLTRLIERGEGFQLVIAGFTSQRYRQQLIAQLDHGHPDAAQIEIADDADVEAFVARLRENGDHRPLHVTGLEPWLRHAGSEAFRALNYRRESLAETVPTLIVLWVEPPTINVLATEAPDLWAWRAAVLDFSDRPVETVAIHHEPLFLGTAERETRERRLAEIRVYLAGQTRLSAADAELLLEACDIERSLGRLDEARNNAEQAGKTFAEADNALGVALARGRIARMLATQGNTDEALRIHLEEELPIYKKLGIDVLQAKTFGQMADILEERGELVQALNIRQHIELPIYKRLGDLHAETTTLGQIAETLSALGDSAKALDILQHEVVPSFERIGDTRAATVFQGKVADIFQLRGELDAALHIRRNVEIPVFERLGETRERAIAFGKIADILQFQGGLDEALRIRLEEELPVYSRLGDIRAEAITKAKVAALKKSRGEFDQALHVLRQEVLPDLVRLGDRNSQAVTLGEIAEILIEQGKFDEASILLAERISLSEQIGDRDGLAHGQYLRALLAIRRGPLTDLILQEIEKDLTRAIAISRENGRPAGVGPIGEQLAQVLEKQGRRAEALVLLDEAEAAWRKLGDASSLLRVATLRQNLTLPSGMPAENRPSGDSP